MKMEGVASRGSCGGASLGALFVVFVVPETRGKSVTEVLTELRGGVRADVRINIVRA